MRFNLRSLKIREENWKQILSENSETMKFRLKILCLIIYTKEVFIVAGKKFKKRLGVPNSPSKIEYLEQ